MCIYVSAEAIIASYTQRKAESEHMDATGKAEKESDATQRHIKDEPMDVNATVKEEQSRDATLRHINDDGMMVDATADDVATAVTIGGNKVKISADLTSAVRAAARAASRELLVCDGKQLGGMSVHVRCMVLSRSGCEAYSLNDGYATLPGACARLIVQIPSTYSADTGNGVVTTRLDDMKDTFMAGGNKANTFAYVYAYAQSSIWIHAPAEGCAAFLVCDVVCAGPIRTPTFARNQRAQKALSASVQRWHDLECYDKLAFPLEQTWESLRESGTFSAANLVHDRDRALVRTLMDCAELDVGFAGVLVCMSVYFYVCIMSMDVCIHTHEFMYVWMYACVYVCMHASMHTCMYAGMYVCTQVCMSAWVCGCRAVWV
jgi:hypothetical protein